MSPKKIANPLASQIDDAKKSVKEWPTWMQELAYFSTTSSSTISTPLSSGKKSPSPTIRKSK